MNPEQYEELCRLCIANELRIPIEEIKSDKIPSAIRPGLAEYDNQIDLYWEHEDKLTRNLIIVNAKWRSADKDKVDQPDVLLIQQVKQEIAANKAMIITNTDFTRGAQRAAENHRIALHIVQPDSDLVILDSALKDRRAIQIQFQKLSIDSKPLYTCNVVHRAFDLGTDEANQSSGPSNTVPHSKEKVPTYSNKMVQPRSYTQKVQTVQNRQGTGGQSGTVQNRQGTGRQSGSVKGSRSSPGGGRFNRGR